MFTITDLTIFFPLFYQKLFFNYFSSAENSLLAKTSCGLSSFTYDDPANLEYYNGHKLEIINGIVVTNASALPWMAVLFNDPKPYGPLTPCSATIISEKHIMTAGHCLFPFLINSTGNDTGPWKPAETDWFTIHVGTVNWNDTHHGGIKIRSKKVFPHPNYTEAGTHYDTSDIAIIELSSPLKFSETVQPICLSNYGKKAGEKAMIAGFGQTQGKKYKIQSKLHIGTVKIEEDDVCKSVDPRLNMEYLICTQAFPSAICSGDSGGALLQKYQFSKNSPSRWFQLGVSIADMGGSCVPPDIHTRIAKHCSWIQEVTNGLAYCLPNFE